MAKNKYEQHSIDRLPDELIISIVSRLPVREAVRTSVLAHKWRYFWMFNSFLIFDALHVLGKLKNQKTALKTNRLRFVECVDKILNLHSSETINEFRILFDLDESFAERLDRWIEFAFMKRVKKLELNFAYSYTGFLIKAYTFPRILSLGLSSCESLVTLSLAYVDVAEEVLVFFISSCPFLEELCVKGSTCLKNLRTSCQASRLRRLEIVWCLNLRSLEICSPNLLSYTFFGMDKISMDLKSASSLISLSLGAIKPDALICELNQISRSLSRLETLSLRTYIFQGELQKLSSRFGLITKPTLEVYNCLQFASAWWSLRKSLVSEVISKPPQLPLLKKLVIEIYVTGDQTLLFFTRILNAAPSLREIIWKPRCYGSSTNKELRQYGLRHHSLEVLQFEGFRGYTTDIELALYVMEHAVSLKKIVIYFHQTATRQHGDDVGMSTPMTTTAIEGVRILKAELPEGVELIMP